MADKDKPSQPSTSRAMKSMAPSSASGRKVPIMKPTVGKKPPFLAGGKNTVLSKPLLSARPAEASGPMRARNMTFSGRKPVHPKDLYKDALYDLYLINYLSAVLAKKSALIQEHRNLEKAVKLSSQIVHSAHLLVKAYVNKVLLQIFNNLKKLETISTAFGNLLDFAGEEALVEIQSILSNKFERIVVEGATVENGSIFSGIEIEKLVDKLRTHLSKNFDKGKVSGFTIAFCNTLKKASMLWATAEKTNSDLQEENKIAVETCSLDICEIACLSFNEDEGEQDDKNGDDDFENALNQEDDQEGAAVVLSVRNKIGRGIKLLDDD